MERNNILSARALVFLLHHLARPRIGEALLYVGPVQSGGSDYLDDRRRKKLHPAL
jgi:hypothetical protein